MDRDFDWGDGHLMQCARNVLLGCALENCMVSEIITPINLI